MSKLECKDLSKSFSISGDTIEVINNINLSITEGDKVAITGKSGAGKSTLLQILASLDSPTSGRVYLDQTDFASLSNDGLSQIRLHNFGFVYQFHHLVPEFSALENVAMPLMLRRESNFKDVKRQAEYLLDRVGLSHRMEHKPGELSGGERQRVALARALVTKPAVVLADEPTGNLDRKTALSIFELLTDLKKELNMAMLIVTHDEQLAQSADSILHMQDGLWIDQP